MAKLKEVLDRESLGQMIESIRRGTPVEVSLEHKTHRILRFGENPVFTFECDRCGNSQHNAITGILEILNRQEKEFTRREIESLIIFKGFLSPRRHKVFQLATGRS